MSGTTTNTDNAKEAPKKPAPDAVQEDHAKVAEGAASKLAADATTAAPKTTEANTAKPGETGKTDAPATPGTKSEASGDKADGTKTETAKAEDGKDNKDSKEHKDHQKDGKDHDDEHQVSDAAHLSAEVMKYWKQAHMDTKGKGVLGFVLPSDKLKFEGAPLDMSPGKKLFASNDFVLTGDLTAARMSPVKLEVPAPKPANAEGKPEAPGTEKPVAAADAPAPGKPVQPGDVADPAKAAKEGDKPADDSSKSWWSKAWDGATSVVEGGINTIKSAYKEVFSKTASEALDTVGDTTEQTLAKAKANKDITITSKSDVASGELKNVMANTADSTHLIDKDSHVIKTPDGLTITRDRDTKYTKIEKEGGSTLERFADGSEKVTKPNGDVITKYDNEHVEVKNAKDGTSTILKGKEVTQQFPEFTIRQTTHNIMEQIKAGEVPPPGQCVAAPDATACSTTEGTSVVGKDNKLTLLSATEPGRVVVDATNQTVTRMDDKGVPVPGEKDVPMEEFKRRNHGRLEFGGFKFGDKPGVAHAESTNGAVNMTYNAETKTPDLKLTVQEGPHKGNVIDVTTEGSRTKYDYHTPDGTPIKESSVDLNDDKHLYTQTGVDANNPESNYNFSFDPDKGFTFGEYNDLADTQPEFSFGADGSFFGGLDFDSDGSIYESDGYGGRTYYYDGSDEAYASSTSVAASASTSGQSVASTVQAAASAGGVVSAEQYRGMAIGAIGSVDAAIQACLTSDNWSALGNLIATKDSLIAALNRMTERSQNFQKASADGLSQDQAFKAAEVADGSAGIRTAIDLVKERQEGRRSTGRTPTSWA